ncbi:AMP-binding protein [Acidimicrobiia bacterium EGI L10123]|uniref:AMP-binding protein n=1 Tax=Salinilacustrithrix flava TaxID=2957203 RepID=UPI003D7C1A72|nr:AMP-binding protein [Acidimicrobiia bacterium EGI L10123]
MDFHFASAWERVADTVPAAEAVVMGDQRWTYAAFDDAAARFASAMEAAGVARGSQVSLYLHNCPEYLIAQHAAFKHGCGPVNVNYRYLDDELVYLVDNSDSEVLVFHASLGDRVERVRHRLDRVRLFVVVDDDGTGSEHDFASGFHDLVAAHEPQPRWDRSPQDLYMLYTGGTTGLPKGVMYDNGVFCNALLAGAALLNGLPAPASLDDVGDLVRGVRELGPVVSVPCCPLMHGTGMWVGAMPALNVGGTVVLLQSRSFDADELLDVIESEGVTRCAIVGDAFARPILRALEAAEARGELPDLSSLKTISSSGAMWSAEIKDGLTRYTSAVLSDGLGSTEGGGYGTVTADRTAKGTTARFTPTPDTLVLGTDDLPVTPGSPEPGLLATRTGAHGYYKDPEKTARTFKQIDGNGYVITGDWATLHEDGTITLHGRGSNCINSGGEKIFPEEVEEALKTHPAVDDCYVVGVPDDRFGQRVVAVVGCTAGAEPPVEDDLRTHLREVLASYKIPRQIAVVDHLHRAPNGKADYGWAREQVLATQPAAPA